MGVIVFWYFEKDVFIFRGVYFIEILVVFSTSLDNCVFLLKSSILVLVDYKFRLLSFSDLLSRTMITIQISLSIYMYIVICNVECKIENAIQAQFEL